jgi:phosphoribosylaminoimidazolecarboxamide formyltransferase / IMP cyclohydrolase
MRVLISVFDKVNIEILAKNLLNLGWEIISTGGTAHFLESVGIPVLQVSEVTEMTELLEGRVKTLHPKVLGGILANRKKSSHIADLKRENIKPIDMVIVNLYPFRDVVGKEDVKLEDALEHIDIGGVTLLRSAAKNYSDVVVVSDPEDYDEVIKNIKKKSVSKKFRERMAIKAFQQTQKYDFSIEQFFRKRFTGESIESYRLRDVKPLGKYAENWHQKGKVGVWEGNKESSVIQAKHLHGKGLGYNNYLDADSALNVAKEVKEGSCVVIVKHGNPCGMSIAGNSVEAFERAWQGDPVSSYGSVVALNQVVDLKTMEVICSRSNFQNKKGWFVELMIAPGFSKKAIELVKSLPSKDNLRLLSVGPFKENRIDDFRGIIGGMLIQERDRHLFLGSELKELFNKPYQMKNRVDGKMMTVGIMTNRSPDFNYQGLYQFAMIVSKHLKSNAISIVREYSEGCYQIIGMGAGQPNRKDSTGKLAIVKAKENLTLEYYWLKNKKDSAWRSMMLSQVNVMDSSLAKNFSLEEYIRHQFENYCVVGSDAFFPFSDSIELLAREGIKNVIQPGGSIHDIDVVKEADKNNMAMVFSGMRHFRH